MITVLVRVERGVEALAATLASLVPGVMAGLVADAIVLAEGTNGDIARLAEVVGAALVIAPQGAWASAAATARREWVWCLLDGDAPGEDWIRAVGHFVSLAPMDGRMLGRPSYRPLASPARTARLLEKAVGTRRVRAGDLIRRDLLAAPAFRVRPLALPTVVARDPAFR
jgi:hypothetical protein